MKSTLIKLAIASTVLLATPVLAQSQSSQEPTVAATLPDAFGTPQAAAPRPATPPPAAAPAASAQKTARAETALRAVISGLQSGNLDYSTFSTDLAAQVREQADTIGGLLTQFGPLKTITHKGQPQGADLFEIQFEKQKTEWLIGFGDDGKIAALLFRPAED